MVETDAFSRWGVCGGVGVVVDVVEVVVDVVEVVVVMFSGMDVEVVDVDVVVVVVVFSSGDSGGRTSKTAKSSLLSFAKKNSAFVV